LKNFYSGLLEGLVRGLKKFAKLTSRKRKKQGGSPSDCEKTKPFLQRILYI